MDLPSDSEPSESSSRMSFEEAGVEQGAEYADFAVDPFGEKSVEQADLVYDAVSSYYDPEAEPEDEPDKLDDSFEMAEPEEDEYGETAAFMDDKMEYDDEQLAVLAAETDALEDALPEITASAFADGNDLSAAIESEYADETKEEEEQTDDEAEGKKRRNSGDASDSSVESKKQKAENESDSEEQNAAEIKIGAMRKNIREVMDETKLEESTLAAQRQEMERLRRVQEQQKMIREVQKQIAQNRQNSKMQARVLSLLQKGTTSIVKKEEDTSASVEEQKPNTVVVQLCTGSGPDQIVDRKMLDLLKKQNSSSAVEEENIPSEKLVNLPKNLSKPQMMTASVSIAPVQKKPLESAEEKPKPKKEVVVVASSSDDDDCIVISEEEEESEPEEDTSNSGMHTNDLYNVPDDQGRVLINVGHPESEKDVFLSPQIGRIIKPHQIGGVRFLYDNLVESLERFKTSDGFGCILAHSMGLGKTLQVISFCDVFLRYTEGRKVLCIMPINTLQNWVAEFNMWLPVDVENSPMTEFGEVLPRQFPLFVLNDSLKTLSARANVIKSWNTDGGVLLIGYELYRQLCLKKPPKPRNRSKRRTELEEELEDEKGKHMLEEMYQALVRPGPDLVICDEGHRIKNSHASISQALKQIRSKRRVVLTGYPLQNNLLEYWCMVDFVRPNYLGTKTEFSNMFERPIQNGQCIDSTPQDIKLMRFRAHVLHSLLEGFVQRRSHSVLQETLPSKYEYVLLLRLTSFQKKLYNTFMNEVVRSKAVPNPLKAFAVCCKIWNHPDILYDFLKKRAGDEELDLDLEETATNLGTPASGPNTPMTPSTPPLNTAVKRKHGRPRKDSKLPRKGNASRTNTPQPINKAPSVATVLPNVANNSSKSDDSNQSLPPFSSYNEQYQNYNYSQSSNSPNFGGRYVQNSGNTPSNNPEFNNFPQQSYSEMGGNYYQNEYQQQNPNFWPGDNETNFYSGNNSRTDNYYTGPMSSANSQFGVDMDSKESMYNSGGNFNFANSQTPISNTYNIKQENIDDQAYSAGDNANQMMPTFDKSEIFNANFSMQARGKIAQNQMEMGQDFGRQSKSVQRSPDKASQQAQLSFNAFLQQQQGKRPVANAPKQRSPPNYRPDSDKLDFKPGLLGGGLDKIPPTSVAVSSNQSIQQINFKPGLLGGGPDKIPQNNVLLSGNQGVQQVNQPFDPMTFAPSDASSTAHHNTGFLDALRSEQLWNPSNISQEYNRDPNYGYENTQPIGSAVAENNYQSADNNLFPLDSFGYDLQDPSFSNLGHTSFMGLLEGADDALNNDLANSLSLSNSYFPPDNGSQSNSLLSSIRQETVSRVGGLALSSSAANEYNASQTIAQDNSTLLDKKEVKVESFVGNLSDRLPSINTFNTSQNFVPNARLAQDTNFQYSFENQNPVEPQPPGQWNFNPNFDSPATEQLYSQEQKLLNTSGSSVESGKSDGSFKASSFEQNTAAMIKTESSNAFSQNSADIKLKCEAGSQTVNIMPSDSQQISGQGTQINQNIQLHEIKQENHQQFIHHQQSTPIHDLVQLKQNLCSQNVQTNQSVLQRGANQMHNMHPCQNIPIQGTNVNQNSLQPNSQTQLHPQCTPIHSQSALMKQNVQSQSTMINQNVQPQSTMINQNVQMHQVTNQGTMLQSNTNNSQHNQGYTQTVPQQSGHVLTMGQPNHTHSSQQNNQLQNVQKTHSQYMTQQTQHIQSKSQQGLQNTVQPHANSQTLTQAQQVNQTHSINMNIESNQHVAFENNKLFQQSENEQLKQKLDVEQISSGTYASNAYSQNTADANRVIKKEIIEHPPNYQGSNTNSDIKTGLISEYDEMQMQHENNHRANSTTNIAQDDIKSRFLANRNVSLLISNNKSDSKANQMSQTCFQPISSPNEKPSQLNIPSNAFKPNVDKKPGRLNQGSVFNQRFMPKSETSNLGQMSQLNEAVQPSGQFPKMDAYFKENASGDDDLEEGEIRMPAPEAPTPSRGREEPGIPYDWANDFFKDYEPGKIDASAKTLIFFCMLEEIIRLGDRLLLFSQSLFTLNLLENFLHELTIPNTDEKFARNKNYFRLDGSTSALEREKLINEFNCNPSIHLFLVSTRAGSLGINLVGANRVVVFDASWNPCHDTQAVCRVYRYGQQKSCYVYRFVMDNCLEKKIYDRQINKQGMADRVVDECNPEAHLTIKDVTNLCFDDEDDTDSKNDFAHLKDKYNDVVIQKIVEKFSSSLSKEPFQHESLLIDRKDKKLSQAEKRMAKRSYELEKQANSRPQYAFYGNPHMSQNRMGKPMASVRPMQQMNREGGRRWIPAEVWQKQGMSAQEMTLPLDVVIPTNTADSRSSIVLKAGQKVMVLKSPKGIYMQLENGKIIAIKTAAKPGAGGSGVLNVGKPMSGNRNMNQPGMRMGPRPANDRTLAALSNRRDVTVTSVRHQQRMPRPPMGPRGMPTRGGTPSRPHFQRGRPPQPRAFSQRMPMPNNRFARPPGQRPPIFGPNSSVTISYANDKHKPPDDGLNDADLLNYDEYSNPNMMPDRVMKPDPAKMNYPSSAGGPYVRRADGSAKQQSSGKQPTLFGKEKATKMAVDSIRYKKDVNLTPVHVSGVGAFKVRKDFSGTASSHDSEPEQRWQSPSKAPADAKVALPKGDVEAPRSSSISIFPVAKKEPETRVAERPARFADDDSTPEKRDKHEKSMYDEFQERYLGAGPYQAPFANFAQGAYQFGGQPRQSFQGSQYPGQAAYSNRQYDQFNAYYDKEAPAPQPPP